MTLTRDQQLVIAGDARTHGLISDAEWERRVLQALDEPNTED